MQYKKKVWLISDPHWGHKGVCVFTDSKTGKKIRPWDCTEKMNADMSALWNETVDPRDKVYCLGDWAINRKFANYGQHLHGDKILIKGNHDIFELDLYLQVFRDVRAYHVLGGAILSHIPVHENQLERFGLNIHGHSHTNQVMKPVGVDVRANKVKFSDLEIDPRYICVSVEQIGFKPILLEEVLSNAVARGAVIENKRGNR